MRNTAKKVHPLDYTPLRKMWDWCSDEQRQQLHVWWIQGFLSSCIYTETNRHFRKIIEDNKTTSSICNKSKYRILQQRTNIVDHRIYFLS